MMEIFHDPARHGTYTAQEISTGSTHASTVDTWFVVTWRDRVRYSGALEIIAASREELRLRKAAGGETDPMLTDEQLLTALLVLAAEGTPLLVSNIAKFIRTRLTDAGRSALGIDHLFDGPDEFDPDDPNGGNTPRRGTSHNCYFIAYRALHRLLDAIDGWSAPRGLKLRDERIKIESARDPVHTAVMRGRGLAVINALLETTWNAQPSMLRRQELALAIDQTALRSTSQRSRWRRVNGVEQEKYNRYTGEEIERPVLELEADLYPKERGTSKRDPDKRTNSVTRWEMSWMATIVVDVSDVPGAPRHLQPPQLARGFILDTPNKRIGESAVELVKNILARGHSVSRLTVDRGYNALNLDSFHRPLRRAGVPLVMDYLSRQKGITPMPKNENQTSSDASGADVDAEEIKRRKRRGTGITNGKKDRYEDLDKMSGALPVEGRFHCPAMRLLIIQATEDYDAGLISWETLQKRILERRLFELHLHQNADQNGKTKYSCPALGRSSTVRCPRRYNGGLHPKAVASKERGTVFKQDLDFPEYKVCTQTSITIGPEYGERERQKYQYQSPEWSKAYHYDRNTDESFNDHLKAQYSVDDQARRKVRGLAAQQLLIGIQVVIANANRILGYLHKLENWAKRTGNVLLQVPPSSERPPERPSNQHRNERGWTRYMAHPPPLYEMDTPPPWDTVPDELNKPDAGESS
ncbi:hypothetical protein [Curtobacterium flaccumfaciens]|uniref:hypothetical protein n=1 Tax=Curtobacterium flaccumfaciens TaxID=2035 RepID=UPI00341B2E86